MAIPAFFGTMLAEGVALKKRAERNGPSPVDYEPKDTFASLAMGTGSLILPIYLRKFTKEFRPIGGKYGKALVAVGATAFVATTVADRLAKKRRDTGASSGATSGAPDVAERIAAVAGPVAVGSIWLGVTATWGYHTSPQALFRRRITKDRGNGIGSMIAAVVCWDFVYYWNHRFGHEFRFLWANHVSHHSSQRYNLSTALRQAWGDAFGTYVPYFVALFGVPPASIEAARGINLLYQYWIHTDLISSIGPLEGVLNTASHHRVHHGSNPQYLDKNYGSIVISWDHLFGTFEPEDEPVVYGLTKNIDTFNPLRIATHEAVDIFTDVSRSRTWADRFSFVVRSPGWAYKRRAEMEAAVANEDVYV